MTRLQGDGARLRVSDIEAQLQALISNFDKVNHTTSRLLAWKDQNFDLIAPACGTRVLMSLTLIASEMFTGRRSIATAITHLNDRINGVPDPSKDLLQRPSENWLVFAAKVKAKRLVSRSIATKVALSRRLAASEDRIRELASALDTTRTMLLDAREEAAQFRELSHQIFSSGGMTSPPGPTRQPGRRSDAAADSLSSGYSTKGRHRSPPASMQLPVPVPELASEVPAGIASPSAIPPGSAEKSAPSPQSLRPRPQEAAEKPAAADPMADAQTLDAQVEAASQSISVGLTQQHGSREEAAATGSTAIMTGPAKPSNAPGPPAASLKLRASCPGDVSRTREGVGFRRRSTGSYSAAAAQLSDPLVPLEVAGEAAKPRATDSAAAASGKPPLPSPKISNTSQHSTLHAATAGSITSQSRAALKATSSEKAGATAASNASDSGTGHGTGRHSDRGQRAAVLGAQEAAPAPGEASSHAVTSTPDVKRPSSTGACSSGTSSTAAAAVQRRSSSGKASPLSGKPHQPALQIPAAPLEAPSVAAAVLPPTSPAVPEPSSPHSSSSAAAADSAVPLQTSRSASDADSVSGTTGAAGTAGPAGKSVPASGGSTGTGSRQANLTRASAGSTGRAPLKAVSKLSEPDKQARRSSATDERKLTDSISGASQSSAPRDRVAASKPAIASAGAGQPRKTRKARSRRRNQEESLTGWEVSAVSDEASGHVLFPEGSEMEALKSRRAAEAALVPSTHHESESQSISDQHETECADNPIQARASSQDGATAHPEPDLDDKSPASWSQAQTVMWLSGDDLAPKQLDPSTLDCADMLFSRNDQPPTLGTALRQSQAGQARRHGLTDFSFLPPAIETSELSARQAAAAAAADDDLEDWVD